MTASNESNITFLPHKHVSGIRAVLISFLLNRICCRIFLIETCQLPLLPSMTLMAVYNLTVLNNAAKLGVLGLLLTDVKSSTVLELINPSYRRSKKESCVFVSSMTGA
ncbi:MAG: hypothetical protein GY757_16780 [bacterium]|nr:hypothetical protein [bacterium]